MPLELPTWPPEWPEIRQAVAAVLASGDWGRYRSEVCRELQSRLSRQFGASDCHLTCSGTAAIELALRVSRIGPGDEVIVAAYDFPGNFRTIELLGATPVLVDIAENSPCIDVAQIELAASGKVVAVIASHLYGRAADVGSLRQICDANQWVLIEDACQVPGMKIDERPAGSFGDLATLSFGGSKPISSGTGGALLLNNERLAARLPSIVDRPSDTYPLSALQAAAIGPQLDRLDELNGRRAATAEFLINELAEFDWISSNQHNVKPAYYKLAWNGGRGAVGASAESLPIGQGFRTTAQTSDRRCRKPVPLDRSIELSEACRVLDHRALLIETEQCAALVQLLREFQDEKI
jgi:dTDP-4-amino-4,6-dideoxygalactose transaminase